MPEPRGVFLFMLPVTRGRLSQPSATFPQPDRDRAGFRPAACGSRKADAQEHVLETRRKARSNQTRDILVPEPCEALCQSLMRFRFSSRESLRVRYDLAGSRRRARNQHRRGRHKRTNAYKTEFPMQSNLWNRK